MKKMIFFLILSCIFIVAVCKNIQVPAIKEKEDVDIRLRSLEIMREPEYLFKQVYSREVKESKNDSLINFPPCREAGPQVEFDDLDQVVFKDIPTPPLVIYKFEDIKYSQFLLDILVLNDTIYVMFENGRAGIYTLQKGKFKDSKIIQVEGLNGNRISLGYFALAGDTIVFLNSEYAIKIENKKAFVLEGYAESTGFETVISIGSKYIAAAYSEEGVKIFKVEDNVIKLVTIITKSNFTSYGELELTDLAYFEEQKSLIVLDEDKGISSFLFEESDSGIDLSSMNMVLEKPFCDLMYLHENHLYAVCDEVVKINLSKWPKVQEKVLMHPNIKVREIYAVGNIVAFVGRNVFKLMYMERLVDYYEDQKMDKLVFTDKFIISANQGGIYTGNYNIIQPYLECKTADEKYLGTHHLVFQTKAKCESKFMKAHNIDQSKLGNIEEGDICIYTAYRNVYIWEVGEIFMMPILIAILAFLFIAFIIAVVYLVKRWKLKKLQKELSEYEKLVPGSGHHVELVQENPHKSNASNKEDEEPNMNNEQIHDIE